MKKYRVTEKHPYLKENLIIEGTVLISSEYIGNLLFTDTELNKYLEKGYIEEIQEPEFTKEDMEKAFWSGHNTNLTFYEWINMYKNENKTN